MLILLDLLKKWLRTAKLAGTLLRLAAYPVGKK
jgi:hypothetical protein